jgi:23S rRNA pseudouridine1911/1915/1917 synthase
VGADSIGAGLRTRRVGRAKGGTAKAAGLTAVPGGLVSEAVGHAPACEASGAAAANDTPEGAATAIEADEAFDIRLSTVDAAGHGGRLDHALVALAPEFSRSHLQKLIELGHVQLDGVRAKAASQRLRIGQALRLELVPTDESRAYRPQDMALPIVFEDEHVLVLNKPAGWVVHPAPGHWQGTVLNGLLAHHPGAYALPRAGIVHRLDRDTSGLMVVAKTLAASTELVRMIAAREVHRQYLAIAQARPGAVLPAWAQAQRGRGAPPPSIEAPIARDPQHRQRMAVVAAGKAARTDVDLVAQATLPDTAASVLGLRCTLHSGRTHQIRVHLCFSGFPLLADTLYAGAEGVLGMQRQALHAQRLSLRHPIGGHALAFEQAPPDDFAQAWRALAPA